MKTKIIIRSTGVSPADNRDRCRRVRENAVDSSHPPSHVGGHNRTTATVFLVAASCLSLLSSAIAAPGSWTQKADMPGQTSTPVGCAVDGILYIIGGHYQYTNQLRTVFAYDPLTDSWTRKADMPTARRWPGAAVVDGIIYVISGGGSPQPPVKTVEAYDPKTDTWAAKANIPTGRNAMAACAVDGIIYAIGGFDYSEPGLATVEAYDPKTNQWTRKRDLPRGMYFATASAVDGVIYVFQGRDTFAYKPQTDSWTNKARFSLWSSGTMSVTVDGTIYLFGGMPQGWYGLAYDFTMTYDPAQDRFSARRKMPRTRAAGGCGVIDGKIYLAGGVNTEPIVNPNPVYYKIVDMFDPQGGVTPQILSLACKSTNHVRLMWLGEVGLRYGVESRANFVNGTWTRMSFSSGGNSVLATNSLVEVTCIVPTADTNRFFRVLEL